MKWNINTHIITRFWSLQPDILTVQSSCAFTKKLICHIIQTGLEFFFHVPQHYQSELLDQSPPLSLFRDDGHVTNFWQAAQTNARREHRDEASQAKQPWHWQSERAAIVQRNTPPLMKTPAPHCQQLNLPPPKSPGGGITCEWCTTGWSHGGRRRWQEWLRESMWGLFLLFFQGWKQEKARGGRLERDEKVASTNKPATWRKSF